MMQKVDTSLGKANIYRNTANAERCVLIIPGYSESITHNRELVDAVARRGYDTLTYDQPRRKALADPLVRQQIVIQEILRSTTSANQKVYAVAHSLGAAAALRAARKHPGKFLGLLLMQPSGIGEKQTFFELIRRVGKKTAKNHTGVTRQQKTASTADVYSVTLGQVVRSHASSAAFIVRNPWLAVKEATIAVQHSIAEDIAAVEKLGIPVNIVIVHNDELFSSENPSGYDEVMKKPGVYSSLARKDAKHDTFWMHPEQTAELIDAFAKQINRS